MTTIDAGGPNEFVEDGVNGFVRPPEAQAIGEALATLDSDRRAATAMGEAGAARARQITWAGVIERLVGD